jgi:hypothetical protein
MKYFIFLAAAVVMIKIFQPRLYVDWVETAPGD